ncbi:hypothetical protein AMECASPLE_035330, partial [Ameca splendens]
MESHLPAFLFCWVISITSACSSVVFCSANEASWPNISKGGSDWRSCSPEPLPSGYGTYPSTTHQAAGHHCATSSLPRSAPGTLGWPRSTASSAISSSSSSSCALQQIQQHISLPPNSNH